MIHGICGCCNIPQIHLIVASEMFILSLADFQTTNFILEKRVYNKSYPFDFEEINIVTDVDPKVIAPDSASLFPVNSPNISSLVLNVQTIANVVDFGMLCDFSTVSVSENQFVETSIYPNPSNGRVTVESSSPILKIIVRNTLGQVVSIVDDNQVDLSQFNEGVYLFNIITEAGETIEKVLRK